MRFLIYIVLLVSFNASLFAQNAAQLNDLMGRGKELVQDGEYEQANMIFRRILTLNQSIPSEFCYYFAKSLYHTGQYRNSQSFIDKYFELSGQGGEFINEVKQLEQLIGQEWDRISECDLCNDDGYRLESCQQCHGTGKVMKQCPTCKGKGNIVCDLCSGGGVLIRKNIFNANEYHTCDKCEGSGIIPCPQCEGKKEVVTICSECKGLGETPTGGICNHVPVPHDSSFENQK